MAGLESTSIWQSTLARQLEPDSFEKEREFFRVNYEDFRKNAGILAGEISRDLPDYTVHDLSHLDALWEMASIICGPEYNLNPAEAFVLGGAFLIHDLGMGLAAYPEGITELKKTTLWFDTVAQLTKKDSSAQQHEIEKNATEIVLRSLHAKHAEKLALISWNSSSPLHLIGNPELREAYGAIIGTIAHSHWWSSDEILKRLPPSLGALGSMPNDWGIDPVKLACIMRVADAAHIDDRRAPAILNAFRQPNDYAQQHWLFQQRLYQPRLESERLVYTSKSSFSATESKSWWLCHDTLRMIDKELRDSDSILGDTKRMRFKAKGVAAINNLRLLSKLIGAEGWRPVDTSIHVGDVARLVKNLGGEQLYGKNNLVPLRELIQNSCDAIRARRILEDEPEDWGEIKVRIGNDSKGKFLEIEDNGVGMSIDVLAGPFLDFGTSFWGTSMMHKELPGLESKGFQSSGKFGVGFFSVFMWGESVSVTTRRFEDARQNTKSLVFERGLYDRPLLRDAEKAEYIKDGGTRVRVYFSNDSTFRALFEDFTSSSLELSEIIEDLCPCLDASIYAEDLIKEKSQLVSKANDWKTLSNERFLFRALGNRHTKRLTPESKQKLIELSKNTRELASAGEIIGRGFIWSGLTDTDKRRILLGGAVAVGGFRTSDLSHIVGLFVGYPARASRDVGVPFAAGDVLAAWANEQAKLLSTNPLLPKTGSELETELSEVIRALGGFPTDLKIAKNHKGYLNAKELEEIFRDSTDEFIIASDDSIFLIESDRREKIALLENVIVVDSGIPGILQTRRENFWVEWPEVPTDWFHSYSLAGLVIEIFSKARNTPLEIVKDASDFTTDELTYSRAIGTIQNKEITDTVDIIRQYRHPIN